MRRKLLPFFVFYTLPLIKNPSINNSLSSRGTLHKIKKKRILCEKYSQNHGVLNNFSYLCGNFVFFNMVIEHNYNVVPRELIPNTVIIIIYKTHFLYFTNLTDFYED